MKRRRSDVERTRRVLYKTQRTIGDMQAAASGRLIQRLARRSITKSVFGSLRKGGWW